LRHDTHRSAPAPAGQDPPPPARRRAAKQRRLRS